jgi:hypothetical protein
MLSPKERRFRKLRKLRKLQVTQVSQLGGSRSRELCETREKVAHYILLFDYYSTINWYWETTGGVGKTTLCKYLVGKHDALMLTGKSNDMYHMISKFPQKNK